MSLFDSIARVMGADRHDEAVVDAEWTTRGRPPRDPRRSSCERLLAALRDEPARRVRVRIGRSRGDALETGWSLETRLRADGRIDGRFDDAAGPDERRSIVFDARDAIEWALLDDAGRRIDGGVLAGPPLTPGSVPPSGNGTG